MKWLDPIPAAFLLACKAVRMGYDPSMKFILDQPDGSQPIRGYGADGIRIGNKTYNGTLLVSPKGIRSDWPPQTIGQLSNQHLMEICALRPALVIIGTGEQQVFPEPRVFIPFMDAGIGYEVMDTPAACRTYNVLLSEGREVLAALFV